MTLLGNYLSEIERSPESISKRGRAEAKLLYANWRELTSYYDSEDIQHLFLKVCFVVEKGTCYTSTVCLLAQPLLFLLIKVTSVISV